MKTFALLFTVLAICFSTLTTKSLAQDSCVRAMNKGGGVDVWPWSVAQPFPWDNIQGFWSLGDDQGSFIKVKILSSTSTRKIMSISVYGDGYCSKAYAVGKGYIDVTEKNVVRAIVTDGQYKYQLKIGLFNIADVVANAGQCRKSIMAASMQIIGHAPGRDEDEPLDPSVTGNQNMLLKKVAVDPVKDCKVN